MGPDDAGEDSGPRGEGRADEVRAAMDEPSDAASVVSDGVADRGGGQGFGRPGGWQNADLPPADDAQSWFEGRLPEDWFTGVDVTVDREEIMVFGTLTGEAADAGHGRGPDQPLPRGDP